MIVITCAKGRTSASFEPNLVISAQHRKMVTVLAETFGHLLPEGRHTAHALAEAMRHNAADDNLVQKGFGTHLRELAMLYDPTFLAKPAYITHSVNSAGRDFVVADLHGQYEALQEALRQVAFDPKHDRLFSVGDLIDRGSRSFDCLSLVFEPYFYGVLGNHEALALAALGKGGTQVDWDNWQQNGGSWVLGENAHEVKTILLEAARHLPLAREVAVGGHRIGICHAEPPANWHWLREEPETLVEPTLWGRTRLKKRDTTPVEGIDLVVVGHTIVEQPAWLGNVLYIDTGAFWEKGTLTLIELSGLQLQVMPT